MVVGSGQDSCAPYVAVGVAQHWLDQSSCAPGKPGRDSGQPVRQVYLGEPSPVCYSGLSYLEEETFRTPLVDENVPWPERGDGGPVAFRIFDRKVPGADPTRALAGDRIFIHHLDLPSAMELQALEAQRASAGPTALDYSGADSLIWALPLENSCRLSWLNKLGRLIRIVDPGNVHIVLLAHWRKRSLLQEGRQEDSHLARTRLLLGSVLGEVDFSLRVVGSGRDQRKKDLGDLARNLVPGTQIS